eukprot:22430_1
MDEKDDLNVNNLKDIDTILAEIDENELKDQKKEKWIVGSKCEIYSRSDGEWYEGEINKIFTDNEGEWITVKYKQNHIKEIKRYSDHVKPMTCVKLKSVHINNNETSNDNNVNWKKIVNELRLSHISFIKKLISSKDINVNSKNPSNGKTLLIYACCIGDLELVKTVCNFGADASIKDDNDLDSLDYSIKYGNYKITELVYYRLLSGSLGNDLKNVSVEIHKKNKEAEYLCNNYPNLKKEIIQFMINTIKQQGPFDPTIFYYSWYFQQKEKRDKVMQAPLWQTMMNVYEKILQNTDNKSGWTWLKTQFINSLIWYLPHPNYYDKNEEKNDEKNEENNDENNEENNDENV